jgi:hypothetical protein
MLCIAILGGCSATKLPRDSTTSAATQSFAQVASVLRSPRCLNCHPSGDAPRQGDERRIHDYRVARGTDDGGAAGMRCSTCHQQHNQSASSVPGAPHWQLAPLSMAWEGLSDADLCGSLTDPARNGGRSVERLVQHMTEDPLVQWAFAPGAQRTLPPLSQERFHESVRQWARDGAACPKAGD